MSSDINIVTSTRSGYRLVTFKFGDDVREMWMMCDVFDRSEHRRVHANGSAYIESLDNRKTFHGLNDLVFSSNGAEITHTYFLDSGRRWWDGLQEMGFTVALATP